MKPKLSYRHQLFYLGAFTAPFQKLPYLILILYIYVKSRQYIQIQQMNYQLNTVIEVLLSSDNQRRAEAENYIQELTTNSFTDGVDAFLQSMSHQNPNIASMSALLLKKKYLDMKDTISKVPKEKLQLIVTHVISLMTPDRPLMFLKRCCEILVRVYMFSQANNELIQIIGNMANAQALNMKLALMYFIQITSESTVEDSYLIAYASKLIPIFNKTLADPSNQIQVASFKTLTIFLSTIQNQANMKQFNPLLKNILSKAIELIKFDQESGIIALESLNQLVQSHPKYMKPVFDDLLMIYTEIMETRQLLVNLRSTAMSGILTLCMNHHTLVRKSAHFKNRMVQSYMKMLAELDHTPMEEWAEQLLDEAISKNDISMMTEQHLGQIANELGNKFMLPLFIPLIQQCLSSQQIPYQHAGLTALAILIQNCHESYKKELKSMIGLMLPLLNSQNPRIIHDILIAMGYMATEFAPEIQANFGVMILEFISKALKHSIPKVQYKAVQCIVNFEQGLVQHKDVKVIEPYLPSLLSDLGHIFEHALLQPNYIMLEAVLESMSTIAAINDFAPYYGSFMPGLMKVISMVSNDTPQKVSIKSKTIQTMGDLLASIKLNPQLFDSECSNIMQSLLNLQSQLDSQDVLNRAIFTVYENVVAIMKERFAMYSDFIFERAFEAAMRPVDMQVIDQLDKEKGTGKNPMHKYVKLKLDLKIDGVKNIVFNTDTFEQKIESTNLLSAMAENMGPAYLKYAEKTIIIIKELILFKSSRDIRANMIECCKYIVLCGADNMQKSLILQQIEGSLTSSLQAAIRCKDHDEVGSITETYSAVRPYMTEAMVNSLPIKLKAVMGMVESMVKEIEKIYSEKEMDDDLTEEMNNQTDQVEECLEHIEEIIKQSAGMPAFEALRAFFPKGYEFSV